MIISEVIKHLEMLKEKHGDIMCCVNEGHEYWGSLETEATENNIKFCPFAQPDGPKSHKPVVNAIIFSYSSQ